MADPSPALRRQSDRRCSACGREGHYASTCAARETTPPHKRCARPGCSDPRQDSRKWCASCLADAREATRAYRAKRRAEGQPSRRRGRPKQDPGMEAVPSTPEMPEPTIPAAPAPADDFPDDTQPLPSRPQTRGDCKDGIRPCPWMSCHHHLLTLVSQGGEGPGNSGPVINALSLPGLRKQPSSIKWKLSPLTDPQANAAADAAMDRLDSLGASCILDIADQGGQTLEQVAERMGVVRERIRQIEVKALKLLREEGEDLGEDEND